MSGGPAQGSGRTPPGRPFKPGQSGNPGGRPKAQAGFTATAKELSIPVLRNMAKIATNGRGIAAVKAGELVLAYAEGKPETSLHVTATRLGPMPEAFEGAAQALLEQALAEDDGATDDETVAPDAERLSLPPVADVDADDVSKACPSEPGKGET
jgi:hypothetical protein